MQKLTVTIEGSQGAGKSRLSDLLEAAILNAGGSASDDRIGTGDNPMPIWHIFGAEVEIIEKQAV